MYSAHQGRFFYFDIQPAKTCWVSLEAIGLCLCLSIFLHLNEKKKKLTEKTFFKSLVKNMGAKGNKHKNLVGAYLLWNHYNLFEHAYILCFIVHNSEFTVSMMYPRISFSDPPDTIHVLATFLSYSSVLICCKAAQCKTAKSVQCVTCLRIFCWHQLLRGAGFNKGKNGTCFSYMLLACNDNM